MRKVIFIFLILFFGFLKPIFAVTYPQPTGLVNDFANVLNAEQKTSLEQNLTDFKSKTGNEIAVVTIKSLNDDVIENAAVQIFEQWKIGQKDKDNGVLLLVTIDDRKLRIEVGYGLEPVLTDAKAGDIIRNAITPEFKKNNYYQGILNGVEDIKKVITGEKIITKAKTNYEGIFAIFGILIWFLIPVIIYVVAFFGRSKAIWPGGLVGLIIGVIIAGIAGAIIAGLIGLFLDWILSRNYEKLSKLGKSTKWWHTAGGFWLGSGGGFSGGSSGGGGSSGSW